METNKEYLARLLPLLKKPIKSQWRVQSFSKKKPVATVMSYIDQRDLMDVLDAYCEYGWQKRYEEVSGNLFCYIGINMPDGSVHWRSDCGVESQADKEKGQASDAAKRAGVNWGVGRFLYEMGVEYVTASEVKTASNWPFCIDEGGKQIWDLDKYVNDRLTRQGKGVQPKEPVKVAEPTAEAKVAQMNNTTPPKELTAEELKVHEDAINKISDAVNLSGYYNALSEDVKASKTVISYLSARRKALTPTT